MKCFFLLAVFVVPTALWGTSQMPEILIIDGEEHRMFSTPLEDWLLPDEEEAQEAFRFARQFSVFHSGCWRGYQGRWEIDGDTLILNKITSKGITQQAKENRSRKLHGRSLFFPDWLPTSEQLPMKATYFSGTLRVPLGKELRYVHMGFASIYEKDLYIEIEKGKVVARRTENNADSFETSSEVDLRWIALGGGRVEDDLDWVDARDISQKDGSEVTGSFRTRGILYSESERRQFLIIPETPRTDPIQLQLVSVPKEPEVPNGSHVEVSCSLSMNEEGRSLTIESIRHLSPGESMHHPSFEPSAERTNQAPVPIGAPDESYDPFKE